MSRYYLSYGSNLIISQMRMRCPEARIVGTAVIENYHLLYKGSKTGAYLTIEKAPNGKVPVAVWKVSEADEAALDRYEGFPTFYYKKDFKITMDGAVEGYKVGLDAFAYIMHEERPHGIPMDFYVRGCEEGYDTFGFDKRILRNAYKRSRKAVEKREAKEAKKAAKQAKKEEAIA